ncbi:MAG: hypothetical protein A2096_04265 [Spirochaetes bacterium GWF1_41_5]|nr:MAG: hypothetical protein A2096_04265 [Spirochaetes bacterium GWF1_41_5]HBE04732.1 hypothetical protein [Spirochaetia bacterium]
MRFLIIKYYQSIKNQDHEFQIFFYFIWQSYLIILVNCVILFTASGLSDFHFDKSKDKLSSFFVQLCYYETR